MSSNNFRSSIGELVNAILGSPCGLHLWFSKVSIVLNMNSDHEYPGENPC
jgi:hypothetical protein